ncbi:protein shisa-4-like isoform 1-T2 [Fundulus diaphanus]
MAPGLSGVAVLVFCAAMSTRVFAWDDDCDSYRDSYNVYHSSQDCKIGFCCGTCDNRQCCTDSFRRLSELAQQTCDRKFSNDFIEESPMPMIISIVGSIFLLLVLGCCCICPCCCIYKMCHKPQPVVATTTHTTVVTSAPQQYPRQPTSVPGPPQTYQATQYPPYQPMPVQPGYGTHPMPTSPYKGQPFTPGPPPPYQDAIGPAYPPSHAMPYSQAAFSPGQPAYPLQPPTHPQPNAPPSQMDFLAQPAYNPDFVVPPNNG